MMRVQTRVPRVLLQPGECPPDLLQLCLPIWIPSLKQLEERGRLTREAQLERHATLVLILAIVGILSEAA